MFPPVTLIVSGKQIQMLAEVAINTRHLQPLFYSIYLHFSITKYNVCFFLLGLDLHTSSTIATGNFYSKNLQSKTSIVFIPLLGLDLHTWLAHRTTTFSH